MIKIYRKTATIKAERFDGSADMIGKYKIISTHLACTAGGFEGAYFLPTLEGELRVNIGDWLATGVKNEHWAISDDVFKKTYAELPVIPRAVADWIDKCKHDGIAIASAMDKEKFPKRVTDYFRTYYTRVQWIKLQDDFARAWLDGYVVEADK